MGNGNGNGNVNRNRELDKNRMRWNGMEWNKVVVKNIMEKDSGFMGKIMTFLGLGFCLIFLCLDIYVMNMALYEIASI